MRSCASCGRPLGKVARRCLYCGTPAGDVESAPEDKRKPVVVSCPGCVRKLRIQPDTIGSCSYCALALFVDGAANVRLGPAPGAAPASEADVAAVVADLPRARLWDLVADVLAARARIGELGAGEAEWVVRSLVAVASWPDRTQWLPVTLDEVSTIVPRCLLGVIDGTVYRDQGDPYLRVGLGTKPRAGLNSAERAVVDAFGFASGIALGVGFGLGADDRIETQVRLWFLIDLEPVDDGVALHEMAYQVDEGEPTLADPRTRADIDARLTACRPLLAGYFLLGALFGPSCRGGTAFSLTRDGIAQRLASLGCIATDELVDRLHLRMPTAFGWPA